MLLGFENPLLELWTQFRNGRPLTSINIFDIFLRRANLGIHGTLLAVAVLFGLAVILDGNSAVDFAVFLGVMAPFAHSFAAAWAASPDRRALLWASLLWPLLTLSFQVLGSFAFAMGGVGHHGGSDQSTFQYVVAMLVLAVIHAAPIVFLSSRSPNLFAEARYLRVVKGLGIGAACLLIAAALSNQLQH